mmetsp:Transcript_16970/g.31728  ORF Transcript_16970/g.31728 Transcript_16970/m.31728 type:complete len:126 (-) Transcript_16970:260-637(-)
MIPDENYCVLLSRFWQVLDVVSPLHHLSRRLTHIYHCSQIRREHTIYHNKIISAIKTKPILPCSQNESLMGRCSHYRNTNSFELIWMVLSRQHEGRRRHTAKPRLHVGCSILSLYQQDRNKRVCV